MNSMIDALLALSQLSSQPLARQPVNLSQLAGYVVDDLRRQQPEREVEVEIEPGLQVAGRPDAAAHGAREPARQRLEVQRQRQRRRRSASSAAHGEPTSVHGARQRRRLRHALRRPPVRRLPAPAQRERVSRAPASAWPRCGASCAATAARSGPSPSPTAARAFTSRCRSTRRGTAALASAPASAAAGSAAQLLDRAEQRSACGATGWPARPRAMALQPLAAPAPRASASSGASARRRPSPPASSASAGSGAALLPRRRARRSAPRCASSVRERRLDRRHDLPDVERLDQVGHRAERLHLRHRLRRRKTPTGT